MLSQAQDLAKQAMQSNKSSFWAAASKNFNNFNRNSGMFETRKK